MTKTLPHYCRPALWMLFASVGLCCCGGCHIWRNVGVSSTATIASRQYVQQAAEAMHQNNENEAGQKLLLALKTNPGNAEARAMYADVLWDADRRQEAITELKQVADSAEATPATHIKLARMYFETGDLAMSQRYLSSGIRRDLGQSDAWVLQGEIYTAQNRHRSALTAFHQAIYHDAENWRAHIYLADLYLLMKNPQRAMETAQFVRHKFPPDQEPTEVLYCEGLAMYHLGRFTEAAETLAVAETRSPRDIRIISTLADAQRRAGMNAAAAQTAARGLAIDPDNALCRHVAENIATPAFMNVHPQIGGQ